MKRTHLVDVRLVWLVATLALVSFVFSTGCSKPISGRFALVAGPSFGQAIRRIQRGSTTKIRWPRNHRPGLRIICPYHAFSLFDKVQYSI
jgi:hypothetical protein